MPARGIAKTAPKMPRSLAPRARDIKTKTGGIPTNLLVKIGERMFPSICWMRIKAIRTKKAFNQESKATKTKAMAPTIIGPKTGTKSKTPAKRAKEKA